MTTNTSALPDSLIEFYGEPISTYTRAQAIEDGALVDVSDLAREAGYNLPTAMTRAAWADLAEWSPEHDKRKREFTGQDTTGRLWDVLNVMRVAARRALAEAARNGAATRETHVYRVPPTGRGLRARPTRFRVHVGGGDDGAPVITLMLPGED